MDNGGWNGRIRNYRGHADDLIENTAVLLAACALPNYFGRSLLYKRCNHSALLLLVISIGGFSAPSTPFTVHRLIQALEIYPTVSPTMFAKALAIAALDGRRTNQLTTKANNILVRHTAGGDNRDRAVNHVETNEISLSIFHSTKKSHRKTVAILLSCTEQSLYEYSKQLFHAIACQ